MCRRLVFGSASLDRTKPCCYIGAQEGEVVAMQGIPSGYLPELLRGNTETLLLFLVDELRYTYGYHLIKETEERTRGFLQFKEGTIYPALRKLENDGLIQGQWKEMPNGQERRYYRITEKGKEALRKKITAWQDFTTAMKLIFKPNAS